MAFVLYKYVISMYSLDKYYCCIGIPKKEKYVKKTRLNEFGALSYQYVVHLSATDLEATKAQYQKICLKSETILKNLLAQSIVQH